MVDAIDGLVAEGPLAIEKSDKPWNILLERARDAAKLHLKRYVMPNTTSDLAKLIRNNKNIIVSLFKQLLQVVEQVVDSDDARHVIQTAYATELFTQGTGFHRRTAREQYQDIVERVMNITNLTVPQQFNANPDARSLLFKTVTELIKVLYILNKASFLLSQLLRRNHNMGLSDDDADDDADDEGSLVAPRFSLRERAELQNAIAAIAPVQATPTVVMGGQMAAVPVAAYDLGDAALARAEAADNSPDVLAVNAEDLTDNDGGDEAPQSIEPAIPTTPSLPSTPPAAAPTVAPQPAPSLQPAEIPSSPTRPVAPTSTRARLGSIVGVLAIAVAASGISQLRKPTKHSQLAANDRNDGERANAQSGLVAAVLDASTPSTDIPTAVSDRDDGDIANSQAGLAVTPVTAKMHEQVIRDFHSRNADDVSISQVVQALTTEADTAPSFAVCIPNGISLQNRARYMHELARGMYHKLDNKGWRTSHTLSASRQRLVIVIPSGDCSHMTIRHEENPVHGTGWTIVGTSVDFDGSYNTIVPSR